MKSLFILFFLDTTFTLYSSVNLIISSTTHVSLLTESAPAQPSFLERMERECEAERASRVLHTDPEPENVIMEIDMSSCSR